MTRTALIHQSFNNVPNGKKGNTTDLDEPLSCILIKTKQTLFLIAGMLPFLASTLPGFGQCLDTSDLEVWTEDNLCRSGSATIFAWDYTYEQQIDYYNFYSKNNLSGDWDFIGSAVPNFNSEYASLTVTVSDAINHFGASYHNSVNNCESPIVEIRGSRPQVSGQGYSCEEGIAYVTATGGSGFRYYLYRWTGALTEIGNNFTGDFTITDFVTNGNYQVRAKNSSGCWSSYSRVQIDAFRYSAPSVTGDKDLCKGEATTLTASGGSPGKYRWYDAGGNLIPDATEAQYTTPVLTANTSYLAAYIGNDSYGCESAKKEIIVNIHSPPVPSALDRARCGPGEVTLRANTGYVEYWWYNENNQLIGQTNDIRLTVDGQSLSSYRVKGVDQHGCISEYSNTATVAVSHLEPPEPGQFLSCLGGLARLDVLYEGERNGDYDVEWYTSAEETDPYRIVTVVEYEDEAFLEINLEGDTDFWVSVHDRAKWLGCRTERVKFTAVDETLPKPSAWGEGYSCEPNIVHIEVGASPGASVSLYKYFNGDYHYIERNPNNQYTITEYGDNDQFYVRAQANCTGNYTPVFVENIRLDYPVVTGNKDVCEGFGTILTASGGTEGNYLWYDENENIIVGETGSTFNTGSLIESTAYYVSYTQEASEVDVVCESPRRSVQISIVPSPENIPEVAGELQRCGTGTVTLKASGNFAGFQWYDPSGSPIADATSSRVEVDINQLDNPQVYKVIGFSSNGCESDPVEAAVTAFSECVNYITSTALDEQGNAIASTRIYFGLDGKPLQTQAKDHTNGNISVSNTLYDRFGRNIGSTLSAPADQTIFDFLSDFVLNQMGEPYDYSDFDLDILNADPVGNQPHTLGWYYSPNNTVEDHVPITAYPYSRIEYYDDGTGDIKRSAGPGESHRLGSEHEIYTRTFEVSTELDHYLTVRNKLFGIVNGPTTMAGEAIQSVIIDENNNLAVSFADRNENVLMTARGGNWPLPGIRQFTLENGEGSFYLLDADDGVSANSNLSITSVRRNIEVYNGGGTSIPSLEAGFYQVDNGAANLAITPSYGFGDISYNLYDDAGRLIASIAPNGVKQIIDSPVLLNDIMHLPFTTYYTYNHQGWLLSTREPDAGTTHYQYRRDGSIRFSRNADQAVKSHFSYTHYDALGRPIESGEYIGMAVAFGAGTKAIVNNEGPETGWADADQRSWVKTHYDLPDDIPSKTGLNTYTQDFVMGAVSWTENENITTWYSYDEQGRVTWMLQKPKAMPLVFAAEYTYDFLGNVLTTAFKSYVGATVMEQFYHHYEYDADKRLSKAFTSLDGVNQTLQARYIYYLHGPLKRIELEQVKQGIDFVYNIQGWLTRINHPDPNQEPGGDGNSRFNPDAFGMILEYYEKELTNSALGANILPQTDPSEFHFDPEEKGNAQWAIVDHFLFSKSLGGFYEHLADGVPLGMRKYGAQNAWYQKMLEKYRQLK